MVNFFILPFFTAGSRHDSSRSRGWIKMMPTLRTANGATYYRDCLAIC